MYDQQAEVKVVLKEIASLRPGSDEFNNKVKQLQEAIVDRIRQEESELFASIRNNFNVEQQQQLATEFKEAKKQLQRHWFSLTKPYKAYEKWDWRLSRLTEGRNQDKY